MQEELSDKLMLYDLSNIEWEVKLHKYRKRKMKIGAAEQQALKPFYYLKSAFIT